MSVFAQCWPGPHLDVGRVCTSVQCSVQLYRAQYRVVCSTAAIADWDARRSGTVRSEAVYKAASLRLSANSEPSVSTKIAAVRRDSETGRETQITVNSGRHERERGQEEQQVREGKAPSLLTVYDLTISTKDQLAKLMLYSLQKYKFQLCNCFRSRAERLYNDTCILSMF